MNNNLKYFLLIACLFYNSVNPGVSILTKKIIEKYSCNNNTIQSKVKKQNKKKAKTVKSDSSIAKPNVKSEQKLPEKSLEVSESTQRIVTEQTDAKPKTEELTLPVTDANIDIKSKSSEHVQLDTDVRPIEYGIQSKPEQQSSTESSITLPTTDSINDNESKNSESTTQKVENDSQQAKVTIEVKAEDSPLPTIEPIIDTQPKPSEYVLLETDVRPIEHGIQPKTEQSSAESSIMLPTIDSVIDNKPKAPESTTQKLENDSQQAEANAQAKSEESTLSTTESIIDTNTKVYEANTVEIGTQTESVTQTKVEQSTSESTNISCQSVDDKTTNADNNDKTIETNEKDNIDNINKTADENLLKDTIKTIKNKRCIHCNKKLKDTCKSFICFKCKKVVSDENYYILILNGYNNFSKNEY